MHKPVYDVKPSLSDDAAVDLYGDMVDDIVTRYDHVGATEADAEAMLAMGLQRLPRFSNSTRNNAQHERWFLDYITGSDINPGLQSRMDARGYSDPGDYFQWRVRKTEKDRQKKKRQQSIAVQVVVTIATAWCGAPMAVAMGVGAAAGTAAAGGDLGDVIESGLRTGVDAAYFGGYTAFESAVHGEWGDAIETVATHYVAQEAAEGLSNMTGINSAPEFWKDAVVTGGSTFAAGAISVVAHNGSYRDLMVDTAAAATGAYVGGRVGSALFDEHGYSETFTKDYVSRVISGGHKGDFRENMAVSFSYSVASAFETQRKERRQSQPTSLTYMEMWERYSGMLAGTMEMWQRYSGMLADSSDVQRIQAQQNMLYPDPLALYTVCDITTGNITSGGEKDALAWLSNDPISFRMQERGWTGFNNMGPITQNWLRETVRDILAKETEGKDMSKPWAYLDSTPGLHLPSYGNSKADMVWMAMAMGTVGMVQSRGIGGVGWRGDATWRASVANVQGGGDIRLRTTPTRQEAVDLLTKAGANVLRIEPGHQGGRSTHTYPHINFTTANGGRGSIEITAP